MWTKLYLYLKDNGYDVYSIGQHKGECDKPYIVLTQNGQYGNGFTGYTIMDIIVFYPVGVYSEIEFFKSELLEYLKRYGYGKFTGEVTPDIIDDTKKAYTFSTKLQLLKRI